MLYKFERKRSADSPLSELPFFKIGKQNLVMRSDIIENDEQYKIYIDMPGIERENIKILFDNEYLEIFGQRTEVKEGEFLHHERFFGNCERKFYIENVNKDKIKASLKSGVLEIVIPKENKEEKDPTYINID